MDRAPSGKELENVWKHCERGELAKLQNDLLKWPLICSEVDSKNRTLLYIAAINGHLELVKLLTNAGADIDQANVKGSTALHGAAWYKQLDVVVYLLELGVDQSKTNEYNLTAEQECDKFERVKRIFRRHHLEQQFKRGREDDDEKADRMPQELLVANPSYHEDRQAPNIVINKNWKTRVRVVCLSDTHNSPYRASVPDGDILIHCGDFTNKGTETEVLKFAEFLQKQPHKHKVIIAGNHEQWFATQTLHTKQGLLGDCTYLEDSGVTIEGINIYGCPWTDATNMGFGVSFKNPEAQEIFDGIPRHTDILMTHCPPFNVLDLAWHRRRVLEGICDICHKPHAYFSHWGSPQLLNRIKQVQPKINIFGHVHDDVGLKKIDDCKTIFLNVAQDLGPRPIVFDCYV